MSEPNVGNILPDEALALADAMAIRSGLSAAISGKILAELQGVPYEAETPEEMRGAHIGRTVLFLAKVENPDVVSQWSEVIDANHANGGYERMAEDLSAEVGAEVEADAVRGVVHALIGEMRNNANQTDEKVTKDFAKTLSVARQVAVEHGTDPATVYATDELYYETCGRAFTALETAEEMSLVVDSVSEDMLNKILVQQLENFLPKEVLDEISPEGLAELTIGLQLDPEVQRDMHEHVELFKEALRQTATYVFTRIYGAEELNNMPTPYKLNLMPRQPLVALFDTSD
jgi:hypothetical protein